MRWCWWFQTFGRGLTLKVKRHPDHHRFPLLFGLDKGIADGGLHRRDVVQGVIAGASCRNEWRLVDGLIIPRGPQWRFAREDDQGNACAHGGGQGGQDLGQPRSACHRRNADISGLAGKGACGCHGAMFVTHIDHVHAPIR